VNKPAALVLSGDGHTTMASGIRTELEHCAGPDERARRALEVLMDWAAAEEGFLYLCRSNRLHFVASTTGTEPPVDVDSSIEAWLRTSSEEETKTQLPDAETASDSASDFEFVPLVTERTGESLLAGIGVLKRPTTALRKLPRSIVTALGESLLSSGDAAGLRLG
jgi:hypothetical protein